MAKIGRIELVILISLTVYFLFSATNISPMLGTIYGLFALSSVVFILADPKRSIQFRKENDSLLGSVAIGVLAYIVLIVVGTFVIVPTVNKLIDLLGSTTPILSSSQFFNFVSFGIAVPTAETYFFFIVSFDVLSSALNIPIRKEGLGGGKLWMLILGISATFMFFHLSAKGISDPSTLVIVFFMAVISMILVTIYQVGEHAVYFHIAANSSVLLPIAGLFSIVPLTIGKIKNGFK